MIYSKALDKKKGFTLVELLVVIAIISILASTTVAGYYHLLERTAIKNDKALLKQINSVLDSYGIFTHHEGKIHDALIQEFGNEMEIQSLKYGYDIYYIDNLYEFVLRTQTDNENYKNLQHYLNYENIVTNNDSFSIKEYELEVEIIFSDQSDSNGYQLDINDIVIKNSNDIVLKYEFSTMSEVVYNNLPKPTINDGKIKFYYPGKYIISISDGTLEKTIDVSVYNSSPSFSKHPKLETKDDSSFMRPQISYNGPYDFYLPIFSYITIEDYYYDSESCTYKYGNMDNIMTEVFQKDLIDSGRLQITLDGQSVKFKYQNNKYYLIIPNLTDNVNVISITYSYQGFNGKWSEPITQTLILNKEKQSVTLQ